MIWSFSVSWTSTQVIDLLSLFVPMLARFLYSALVLSSVVTSPVNFVGYVACELGTFAWELICLWTGGSNYVNQWCVWTCGSPVLGNFGCMNIKFVMYEPTFVLDVWTCAGCVKISFFPGMIAEARHEWYCLCIILNSSNFYDEKQTSLCNRCHVIAHVLPRHLPRVAT